MHSHHIALAVTATFAVFTPTGAWAQPLDGAPAPPLHAAQVLQDGRSPDARDAAEGRGTFNSPQVVVVKAQPQTRPAPANGIDWGDAGIGAGSLFGLGLVALGGTLLITHRRHPVHDAPHVGL